ncbi:MAG: NUDIX domain-containing protein [Patescibacteria group bacterium]|jgi:8-oxo-dGTP diphosphatase
MKDRNIAVTLECFIKKGNKYLMLHRNPTKRIMPNVWMAAGGHLEFNEGLYACARREVMEETGLKVKNLRVRAIGNAYIGDLKEEFFFHLLLADYDSGTLKPNGDGEFVWLTQEEILQKDSLLAELKTVLPILLDETKPPVSYSAEYEYGNKLLSLTIEQP